MQKVHLKWNFVLNCGFIVESICFVKTSFWKQFFVKSPFEMEFCAEPYPHYGTNFLWPFKLLLITIICYYYYYYYYSYFCDLSLLFINIIISVFFTIIYIIITTIIIFIVVTIITVVIIVIIINVIIIILLLLLFKVNKTSTNSSLFKVIKITFNLGSLEVSKIISILTC